MAGAVEYYLRASRMFVKKFYQLGQYSRSDILPGLLYQLHRTLARVQQSNRTLQSYGAGPRGRLSSSFALFV